MLFAIVNRSVVSTVFLCNIDRVMLFQHNRKFNAHPRNSVSDAKMSIIDVEKWIYKTVMET